MLPPAGEPNNTMMFMSQGGQSEDIAATYRDHFVQYLRFLSEEIIQKATRHEVTQALQSYWQHLLQDRESACVRVSKFAPDHQALIGASSKSDRRRGLSGMSYAAPLMISAVSSAGSVMGSVYLVGSGTGSVYLSSIGALSKLPDLLDISNMAAGPVVVSMAPIVSMFGSLYLVMPHDFAGIFSTTLAAAASAVAPYGVYSMLTLSGAGYMSIMQTLASFGGGTIVSGGGGAATGVGVMSALATLGIYTICMTSYTTVSILQDQLVGAPLPSGGELEVVSPDTSRLIPTDSLPSLLADEIQEVFSNRSRLHNETKYWEAIEKEETNRLWFWQMTVCGIGTVTLFIFLIIAGMVHYRKVPCEDSTQQAPAFKEEITSNGTCPSSVDTSVMQVTSPGEDGDEAQFQTLEDLKFLGELEHERMRSAMTVQEYEAFLQHQKELLRSVHDEIKNEVSTMTVHGTCKEPSP
mmetsp:Transcript_30638/g.57097  ORF Transcript_30638/g.57097 Transcript_30638/m.57097 type:complete len:465 (-) Transcript_30638:1091-2485(-)